MTTIRAPYLTVDENSLAVSAATATDALAALARDLATDPRGVPHKLAQTVLRLCHADSAGISIFEVHGDETVLKPYAVAGHAAPDAAPGDALPVHDSLSVPWRIDGGDGIPAAAGTLWARSHGANCVFDGGDAHMLELLAGFAAAAWQGVAALDAAQAARAALVATEARLGNELDATQRLYELHARLATETDMAAALDLILATACAFTHTDRGCIQLLGGDGSRLEIVAERGYGPASPFVKRFRYPGFAHGSDAARVERQRILIEDTRSFPGLAGSADGAVVLAEGVLATQSTPMVSRKGETVGVLSTQFRTPHRPSDEELRLIDVLAWSGAEFVERHQAQARLRRSEARRAFLLKLSDTLRPLADAAAIEAATTRMVGRHLGASRVLIGEFVGEDVVIGRDYTDGVDSLAGRHPGTVFGAMLVQSCARGDVLVVEDAATDERLDPDVRARWARHGIGRLLAVGLFSGTRMAAAFAVHCRHGAHWRDADIQLVRDVAERVWPAIERARAEAALKDSDRRKDEFLATLAHELRNPLAPISNAVHLMRRPDGRRVTDRLMGIVERQVRQIVKLVDDLLDISRITRGKIELDKQPVSLADAVRDAVETSRPLVERAHHQLTVALPEEPLTLYADSVRLTQVLSNLVNNAAKYTGDGGSIWLSAAHEGDGVVIRVRDNGLGIPGQHLPHVFEMFAQAHQQGESSSGGDGLGIGLTIVRKLVEMHGGTVDAYSAGPHQGSEFVVRLPLLEDHGDSRVAHGAAPHGTLGGQRILVVDDNRDAADTLALLLESHGAATRVAYDGVDALATLDDAVPDAVLLDLGMPGMDGLALARRIRADPRLAGLRLLALTGWGQAADRQRTHDAGFDHHLTKPVDFRALEAWLSSVN